MDTSILLNTKYWVYMATFYLILLTYQDFKNNMKVDDRRNYFMLGVTFSLLSHVPHKIWYLLAIIFIPIIFIELMKYKGKEYIGSGDLSAFRWIMIGYGIMNIVYLAWFFIILLCISLIYVVIKVITKQKDSPTPYFIVILLAFFLNNLLFGLYI